jgi:hypothetical protein
VGEAEPDDLMDSHKTKTAESLKGWKQISAFLGEPLSVVQRWEKMGMPVVRQGRSVTASPDDLNTWLGRESGGKPVHVAEPDTNLLEELKRGLSYVRREQRPRSPRK